MLDAEELLGRARRPLVLGIGGGGDVGGALAVSEACRIHHRASPRLGGLTWERRAIDSVPGARTPEEIEGGRPIAPGVLAATSEIRVRRRRPDRAGLRAGGPVARPADLTGVQDGGRFPLPDRPARSAETHLSVRLLDFDCTSCFSPPSQTLGRETNGV